MRTGVPGAVWCPSPNFGMRRGPEVPSLVVVHYTAMASAEAALQWLCAPEAQVSAHYLIGRDGRLWQMVDECARAWHAGVGRWHGVVDVNSASIGIEIDNPGNAPFSEPAMACLERVLRDVMARWEIGLDGVIGHSDLAPGRKIDPGKRFDWRRLGRRGLAVWPDPVPGVEGDVEALLRRVGYTADAPVAARLAAFRLRFRPGVEGPVDPVDLGLLAALSDGMRG